MAAMPSQGVRLARFFGEVENVLVFLVARDS